MRISYLIGAAFVSFLLLFAPEVSASGAPTGAAKMELSLASSYSANPADGEAGTLGGGPHVRLSGSILRAMFDSDGLYAGDFLAMDFGLGGQSTPNSDDPLFWYDFRLELNLVVGYGFSAGNVYLRAGAMTGNNQTREVFGSGGYAGLLAAVGLHLESLHLELGHGPALEDGGSAYTLGEAGVAISDNVFAGLRVEHFTETTHPALLNTRRVVAFIY